MKVGGGRGGQRGSSLLKPEAPHKHGGEEGGQRFHCDVSMASLVDRRSVVAPSPTALSDFSFISERFASLLFE